MHSIRTTLLCLLIATLLLASSCQKKKSNEEPDLASLDLLRGELNLCGGQDFGETDFSISCAETTRETFDLALSLLHSFEYEEAEKAFAKVIDTDPNCVMAYWGVAMSNFHSLWLQSGTDYLEKGSRVLALAKNLPKSEREEDYLDAIGSFYDNWRSTDHQVRVHRFEEKMEELYKKYRDDREAAIFYALALCAAADPSDKSYKNQKRSGEILESIFPDQPNHPGIAHYIIHNYDYPELAELALPTARRYAKIAPSSAHAQHMPSHIFTRLGLWDESINSNINSTNSAICYSQRIDPAAHWDEELHGMDYLVYAYLQVGDNVKANEQYEYLKTFKKVFPENFKVAYAVAAIPARIVLENKRWEEAATLQVPGSVEINWNQFPWQKAILHFARAMGSLHIGDLTSANKELEILNSLRAQLLNIDDAYKANQVNIQITTVNAWIEFKKANSEKAIELMKEAVQMENSTTKHPVTPGEVLPAGELLGDMYLAMKRPSDALAVYESDLKIHPNRFNSLYGAALSAKEIGDNKKAAQYFGILLEQSKPFESDRSELLVAKEYLDKMGLMVMR